MIEHITAERTANAIMQDTSFIGTYLIVEGMKDYKLYSKFVNIDNGVEVKQVGGKEKVQAVIEILNVRGFNRKVGIIDSDFSRILKDEPSVKNLFLTDYHDNEVMMFKSDALITTLNMYIGREKLNEFLNGREVENIVMSIAEKIGVLKLANHIYTLGLAFKPKTGDGKNLKYKEFICDRTLDFLGEEKMVQTVRNYSNNRGTIVPKTEVVQEKIAEVLEYEYEYEYELEQLVNGHDLTNILFLLLKRVLRSNNKSLSDYNAIEDALIMSYEARYWVETNLFEKLYDWSNHNNLTIFKDDLIDLYHIINNRVAV
ncbi:DUF4435 domain-containing protein [Brevibacillus laterosporus]|uniref:DUF4435 domain-containing protein n=1 Tax=Brevibacillus laterosporus TaxID=1465 RepID=UPI000EB4C558|nr:DUF4435 domain-containing protein [Brevibacillus laterosporus]AYK05132.1 hypothetical protein D8Z77_01135 [Brevibacillus laterosporus]